MARRTKKEEIVEPIIEAVEIEEPAPVVEEKPKRKKKVTVAKVNTPALNVRKEPSLNAEVVTILNESNTVTVLETLDGWLHIEGGYVMSKYITIK